MKRSEFPDNAFTYIGDNNLRLLRYRNKDGDIDSDLLDFAIENLSNIAIFEEASKDILDDLKMKLYVLKFSISDVIDPNIFLLDDTRNLHYFKSNIAWTTIGTEESGTLIEAGSEAHGKASFIYDDKTRQLWYLIELKDFSSIESASHIHVGDSSSLGPAEISLPLGNIKEGVVVLTEEQEKHLFSGNLYVNIPSQKFPTGEIRGQIFPTNLAARGEDGKTIENESIAGVESVSQNEHIYEPLDTEPPKEKKQSDLEDKNSIGEDDNTELNNEDKDLMRSKIGEELIKDLLMQLKNKSEDDSVNIQDMQTKVITKGAPLTRKEINNLPDAAFAVIEKGGKKEDGKTVPRNFRHLPHHTSKVSDPNENSSLDLPRLRNALARMNQIKASSNSDSTERVRRIARAHLIRHAKAALPNSKFAKENASVDDEEVELIDAIKAIDEAMIQEIIDDKLEGKLLSVEEKGSIKFFNVKVGDESFPFTLFFEVFFDENDEPIRIRMFDFDLPVDVIPDVIKFLKSIV